jgi:hypothetical protein
MSEIIGENINEVAQTDEEWIEEDTDDETQLEASIVRESVIVAIEKFLEKTDFFLPFEMPSAIRIERIWSKRKSLDTKIWRADVVVTLLNRKDPDLGGRRIAIRLSHADDTKTADGTALMHIIGPLPPRTIDESLPSQSVLLLTDDERRKKL